MTYEIGEILEAAIWLDGRETTEDLTRFSDDVQSALDAVATEEGLVLSPPEAMTKYPGDDGVPDVPKHISGPDVRLLVVEAEIVQRKPVLQKNANPLCLDLEPKDLARLRGITQKAYAEIMPHMPPLTDRQADTLINDLGPEAAADALRQGAANLSGVLH